MGSSFHAKMVKKQLSLKDALASLGKQEPPRPGTNLSSSQSSQ